MRRQLWNKTEQFLNGNGKTHSAAGKGTTRGFRTLRALAAVALAAAALTACGGGGQDADVHTYKIGLNGSDHETWDKANELLAKDNIHLEYVEFSDYVKPNEALEDGEIDLNAFQTEIYFKNFCEERGYNDLSILAYTQVAPMGIYSDKYKSLDEASGHLTIAIPNDVTNGGRALKFLEKLGYLKLNPDAGLTPTVMDITEYTKDCEIVEMTASQIPASLPDLSFAVINNGVAYDAGLTLKDDALTYEDYQDPEMKNYWNIIAVKTENVDKDDFQKIKAAYNSDEVKQVLEERYAGQSIAVWE